MVYTAKAAVEVVTCEVYPDGSGAPALVRVADFSYACDFLGGEVRLNLVKGPSHGRRANQVAAERATRTYAAYVNENTSPEWRVANVAMYKDS